MMTDTRFLGVDPFSTHVQKMLLDDVAASPRSRTLMKNIAMMLEQTEYLFSDDFAEQLGSEELRQKFKRHSADEVRHLHLWRRYLESRGELLSEFADAWTLPFEDFIEPGWLPDNDKLAAGHRYDRKDIIRVFALAQVLEYRGSRALSLFGQACRNRDDSVCAILDEILKDEDFHVAYLGEEIDAVAGDDLRDYARFAKQQAAKMHSRWERKAWGMRLAWFLDDPDFGGSRRWFWEGIRTHSQKLPKPDLACPDHDERALGWRVEKLVADLPHRLVTGEEAEVEGVASEAEDGVVTVSCDVAGSRAAVWCALQDVDKWHLWHGTTWHAIVREAGSLGVGSRISVRLHGGVAITEEIVAWDEQRRVALRCDDAPFPLSRYRSTIDVEALDETATRITLTMRYQLRRSLLVGLLAKLGLGRELDKVLSRDLAKFKALFENVTSNGRVFAQPDPNGGRLIHPGRAAWRRALGAA